MTTPALNKVVIFGVGLIGGSFARALKHAGAVTKVVGMGRSPASMARALELGIIDEIGGDMAQAIAGADLVLLAAPVAQTGAILASIAPHLQPGTIVTDAGSTKSDVVAAARAALGGKVAQFVPGHPIAGRETNGPDAAIIDLYQGKKVVLTPLAENSAADVERVAAAWRACGAILHNLSPEEHDKVFAAVSHLPHLLAFALVDDIAKKSARGPAVSIRGQRLSRLYAHRRLIAGNVARHQPGQPAGAAAGTGCLPGAVDHLARTPGGQRRRRHRGRVCERPARAAAMDRGD